MSLSEFAEKDCILSRFSFHVLSLLFGSCRLSEFTLAGGYSGGYSGERKNPLGRSLIGNLSRSYEPSSRQLAAYATRFYSSNETKYFTLNKFGVNQVERLVLGPI